MPATTKIKCPHCQEWFEPDRYNAWHQRYCGRLEHPIACPPPETAVSSHHEGTPTPQNSTSRKPRHRMESGTPETRCRSNPEAQKVATGDTAASSWPALLQSGIWEVVTERSGGGGGIWVAGVLL